jgi:hypothetical protein
MNICAIVEGFISTILSAAFIAAIVWIYSWIRNLRLEAKLTDAISPNGIGIDYDPRTHQGSFTLQIHNYANATIRIRSVVFIADMFHIELRPAENKTIYQTPLSNEVVRPKFKRTHITKGALEQDGNPNSMLLPPKTMGIWEVHMKTIEKREWVIKDIFVVFEYATVFGNSALVRMKAKEPILKLVKENFEPLAKDIYNKRQFNLPPKKP